VLLDQLRSSQAWQEVVPRPRGTARTSAEPASQSESSRARSPSPSSSVASLLSQLQPSASGSWPPLPPSRSASIEYQHPTSTSISTVNPILPQPSPSTSHARKPDLKSHTFQQALPHLAQLSEDATFVASITQVWPFQSVLEH